MNTIKAGMLSLLLVLPSCYAADEKAQTISHALKSSIKNCKAFLYLLHEEGAALPILATAAGMAPAMYFGSEHELMRLMLCGYIVTRLTMLENDEIRDDLNKESNVTAAKCYFFGIRHGTFWCGSTMVLMSASFHTLRLLHKAISFLYP